MSEEMGGLYSHGEAMSDAILISKLRFEIEALCGERKVLLEENRLLRADLDDEDYKDLRARVNELESALRGLFTLVETGWLVRDISQDHLPDFALRQIKPVMAMKAASAALEGRQ